MHAQAVRGRPDTVRWAVPDLDLPPGRLLAAPGALGELLAAGTFVAAVVEPRGVVLTLAEGRSWRSDGDRVRSALARALADPSAWQVDPDPDGVLERIVRDVLVGPTGDYVRSHGGEVAVQGVREGVVEVEFRGACAHCSAAGETLNQRLDAAVRARFPQLVRLQDVADHSARRPGLFWPTLRRR